MELLALKIYNLKEVGKPLGLLSPKYIKNIPFVRHIEEYKFARLVRVTIEKYCAASLCDV